jgi:hypothetical protein
VVVVVLLLLLLLLLLPLRCRTLNDAVGSPCIAGLVLAYIFAIEYKPYGQSLGYFSGSIPLSFATYFTGLVALSVSGLWTAVMSYVALLQVGRSPYHLTTHRRPPRVGRAHRHTPRPRDVLVACRLEAASPEADG